MHVTIAVPSTGYHETAMSTALSTIVLELDHAGHDVSLSVNEQAGIAESRNKLVRRSIYEINSDAILWIDSDIFCKANSANSLIEDDKDIVGATYLSRVPPHELCGKPISQKPTNRLEEFEFLPGGFMLVRSNVYKAIPEPWYFETYAYDGVVKEQLLSVLSDITGATVPPEVLSSHEAREWLLSCPHTMSNSEDVSFCKKARRYGYNIWCDLEVTGNIVHMGKKGYSVR